MKPSRPERSRDDVLFLLGVTLWVAVILATWPRAVSFGDELGYVGRAKLILEGHLSYVPNSIAGWYETERGTMAPKYPLLQSLLLLPFGALGPRAMFALAVLGAVWLAATARAVLRSWGKSPAFALLVLAHPTIVILARTTMADLGQAAAALSAWWALRRGRGVATMAWLTLLVALKPTGAVLALAIVAGEALRARAALRARDAATVRRFAWSVAGGLSGLALLVACNYLSNGHAWFDYTHAGPGKPPFSASYAAAVVPSHVVTVLLLPPLLVAGAVTYWRRRELAPLVVSAAFLAMMSVYYFVDAAPKAIETLVIAPRIILPAVVFLLLGWIAWLDDLRAGAWRGRAPDAAPSPPVGRVLGALLVAVPVVVCVGVSARHARYQRAMGSIRDIASALADSYGERTLGVTSNASKAGILHDGPTTLFDPVSNRTAAVFCSEVSASLRQPGADGTCSIPGYHTVAASRGYFALARDDAGGDAY